MSALHGTGSLLLGYGVALAALIGTLMSRRASTRAYLLAPVGAAVAVLIAGVVGSSLLSLLHSRLDPSPSLYVRVPVMVVALAGAGAAVAFWLTRRSAPTDRLKRGAVLADAAPRPRQVRPTPEDLEFAGLPISVDDEVKHFKLIGTTGTGKSTAIRGLMQGALRRGDRAVFADPDFGYLGRFYDPGRGDVILNPFDPRSVRWDLFQELRTPYDYDQLARSLIGEGTGAETTWRSYAQTFFAALVRQVHEAGIDDTKELYRLLTAASADELRVILEGTPAQPFLEPGNERMFGSVRAVATASTTALDYIRVQPGEPFSVRRWVEAGRGTLFLPYRADQIAALRSVISTWMRIAIFQAMSQPEGDHRLWFVIDELDALGAIDGLKDALARLRKFGGRCVLGLQSIAQVSGLYGEADSRTIVENCGNSLILRCSASEDGGTAHFASRLIGEREILRERLTRSTSGNPLDVHRRSHSRTVDHVVEYAVLPSEIEQLPDLAGYVKLASTRQWSRVHLTSSHRTNNVG